MNQKSGERNQSWENESRLSPQDRELLNELRDSLEQPDETDPSISEESVHNVVTRFQEHLRKRTGRTAM